MSQPTDSSSIVLLGDFQRTSFWERLLGREQNDGSRAKLVAAIRDEKPSLLGFLGDLTFRGAAASGWRYFDQAFSSISLTAPQRFAICGNHDYWGGSPRGLAELQKRFSNLEKETWGVLRVGGLSLIYLNSNFKVLGGAETRRQLKWYENQLASDDADPAVNWIAVLSHHPPFSNSPWRKSFAVEKLFVPAFVRSKKTTAMISGHVHAYEHFKSEGKTFLVCGAGGGPRVKLKHGKSATLLDHYSGESPRPFHYVKMQARGNSLAIEIKGFQNPDQPVTLLQELLF